MTYTTPVSFKSKIYIVTNKTFAGLPAGQYIDFLMENPKKPNIVASDMFYTLGIRTCTGGGLKSSKKVRAAGFHFWDERLNGEKLKNTLNKLINLIPDADGGLVIGAKRLTGSDNSVPLFKTVLKELKKACKNLSYFQIMKKPYGSVDFKYSQANDSWYILLTDNTTKNAHSVKTPKKLAEFFEKIYIAPSDRLFVNGKEITKQDMPQFFKKR